MHREDRDPQYGAQGSFADTSVLAGKRSSYRSNRQGERWNRGPGSFQGNRPCRQVDPHWGQTVVRACKAITPGGRLVWQVISELDRPRAANAGGCWASIANIAEQAGLSENHTLELVGELESAGLLCRVRGHPRGGLRDFLFVSLPKNVEDRPPTEFSTIDRRKWLLDQAIALSEHMRTFRKGNSSTFLPEGLDKSPPTRIDYPHGVRCEPTQLSESQTGFDVDPPESRLRPPGNPGGTESGTSSIVAAYSAPSKGSLSSSVTLKSSETTSVTLSAREAVQSETSDPKAPGPCDWRRISEESSRDPLAREKLQSEQIRHGLLGNSCGRGAE